MMQECIWSLLHIVWAIASRYGRTEDNGRWLESDLPDLFEIQERPEAQGRPGKSERGAGAPETPPSEGNAAPR